ncbi:MAG TPA: hypothetical protein VFD60_13000 [Nitrososphaeraceae archaeon]|nr:hypothetical protein [Nitrososphaeraceae archaeon]
MSAIWPDDTSGHRNRKMSSKNEMKYSLIITVQKLYHLLLGAVHRANAKKYGWSKKKTEKCVLEIKKKSRR